MSAFRVRRSFAAPFIITVAAGCSRPAPTESAGSGAALGSAKAPLAATLGSAKAPLAAELVREWNVFVRGEDCIAHEVNRCPPGVRCNPPPPRIVECPPGFDDKVPMITVAELSNQACAIVPPGCKTSACIAATTACPLPFGQALPPLSWAVNTATDGSCHASWSPAVGAPQSVTIPCPVPGVASMLVRRTARDAPCFAEPKDRPKVEVPCPPAADDAK